MRVPMTREELIELIEDSEQISSSPWRWGSTDSYVCLRDGKHYRFTVQCHRDDGLQHYEHVEMTEVEQRQRTITEWVPVENRSETAEKKGNV